ncbi:serine/threonine-protein kinase [Streptomyces sp. NPDC090306]|uniref:serine/threonine-protein kinase n=1 Tax=Streptomyces sp. NPDC090306 TaxID=3365961 RepID=UPI00380E8FA4
MEAVQALGAGDPERVGPYRVVARLGAGGMGRVYLARSKGGRAVAVKVVRPELAEDREFRQRFAREVAAARRVNGVFTAGVVDADAQADPPWLATAYVPGVSLDAAVARHGAWPSGPVTTLAAGLAEALEAIHAAGLVHRDLKPSNVLLAADGPRVIDFGISTATEASAITRTGVVIGTPGFMSPEQLTGDPVGPASDVFALGAVLAFTASGTGPFGTGSAQGLMYRIVHGEPVLGDVPAPLRDLVGRCLAKRPEDRPGVDELLGELTDAAGAARTTLLFTSAAWLPPAVATTVRQVRDGTTDVDGGGGARAAGTPAPDPAGRGAPATPAPPPPHRAPTVTGPVPPVPPAGAPRTPRTPPPAYTPTAYAPDAAGAAGAAAGPGFGPPTPPPGGTPPAGFGAASYGTPPPGTPPPGTLPTPVPGGPGGPRPGSPRRRRRAVIVSVLAAVLAIGLTAWQADALFGGGGSGTGSAGSTYDASPYVSPTYSDTTTPSPTPAVASPSDTAYETPTDTYTPSETPTDTYTPSDTPTPTDDEADLSGEWNGSYICNQGITGVVLTIEQYDDDSVNAVFAFYPAPSNPSVPRGSFAMTGGLEDGVLTLRATHWINQPPDYLTVDLQAAYSTSTPDHLDGRVYGANCTTFSADRD